MRILVLSDIHLEFGPFELPDDLEPFDVAVFAGDIAVPLAASIQWIEQQRRGPLRDRPAIVVPGNHEFYHGEVLAVRRAGQALADQSRGIHLLDPGCIILDGVRFIGATLWSDYNLWGNAAAARLAARHGMNDHRLIRILENRRKRQFTPEHAASRHSRELAYITDLLAEPFAGATVVVSHHAPHRDSVQARFVGDPLAPAFASDLSKVVLEFQPALWIHGHDHGSHDYLVGRTRILANQPGYPRPGGGRENPNFNPRLIVDVT